jgi:hypothetical protein
VRFGAKINFGAVNRMSSPLTTDDIHLERAAYFHLDQDLRERLRVEALDAVLPPDPVADLSFTAVLEAQDVAGHLPT